MEASVGLLFLLASTSALKVYGDYEDYSEYKTGEGKAKEQESLSHWSAAEGDQADQGHGENLHRSNFFTNTGEVADAGSSTGGHVKHQVTKGFQDYHHKNEVGKTTSYIDTSGDSGDHFGKHSDEKAWGDHGRGEINRDHHLSGYSGQKGAAHQFLSQRNEKKDDYKGNNIAEVIYGSKPIFYPNPFFPRVGPFLQVPYPHIY